MGIENMPQNNFSSPEKDVNNKEKLLIKEKFFKEDGIDEIYDGADEYCENKFSDKIDNVAELLSKQNPERAASGLLKLIKEEKDDKRPLSAILYRLEFGKIGISEEGVEYLERMYDLKEYNNPDFHVNRITAEGEVGIFDEDLRLIKYFHLGDLSTDEKKIQAKVMDFTYETLFYNKPNESPEERMKREQYLQDFKENYYKIANDKIFEQTGVRLNNLSFKEQGWFVIYYNQASEEKKDDLRNFVQKYGEEGIKTFLSLESGEEMGEKILEIGEQLKNQPEIADLLFSEYAKNVESINENAEELCKIYEDIFSEKRLDKSEVIQAILGRANKLLINCNEELGNTSQNEQKEIIENIINDFVNQAIANKKELEEFKDIAKHLTTSYFRIYLGEDSEPFELEEIIELLKKRPLNPDNGFSKEKEALQNKNMKDELSQFEDGIKRFTKYDFNRIKTDIEYLEDFTTKLNYNVEIIEKLSYEPEKSNKLRNDLYNVDFIQEERLGREFSHEELLEKTKQEKDRLKKIIKRNTGKINKLKNILPYQAAFEKKLENIIYGKESASLPKEILSNIDKEAVETKKEKIPEKRPLYFPVGISKDLEKWNEVFEGKTQMAKPIDIYAYLFWLNNQGEKATLIVCDEPQKYNYEISYKKTPEEAEESVLKIGKREVEYYKNIVETYNLSNINVIDYRESLKGKNEKFDHYMELAKKLSKNKLISELFLDMVPDSLKKQDNQNPEDFIGYAMAELGHTLSMDGTKISHKNEARYDIIVAIIKNIELSAKESNIEIYNNNGEMNPATDGLILKVRDILRNKINAVKNKLDKDSFACDYYDKMLSSLKKIKGKNGNGGKANNVEFNFVVPSAGSQSMAIVENNNKSKKDNESDIASKVNFKEPYSTYFYSDKSEIICRDQIVGVEKGMVGFRVLSLEKKEQIKYVKKVLKPLLVQYFKTLDNVTPDYFKKAGVKDKNEILSECKNSSNVSDLIKFIQKYIIAPTSFRNSK